jgi:amidophosphoribosyltransferase
LKQLGEECGVIALWNHENASKYAYLGLYALQHRGQESAGIVTLDEGKHHLHKDLGLVGDVFNQATLNRLKGRSAIGHVRYSTTGVNQVNNAQPLSADLLNGPVAVAHNGNLVNAKTLKQQLKESGAIFQGTTDTEAILHLISRTKTNHFATALKEVLPQLEGAFSCVFLTHDSIYAARDSYGFRPLVLGRKKNEFDEESWIVASETCAFDLLGAQFVREIEPGEMISISTAGVDSYQFRKNEKSARCIFEHVYFSRPDSVVFGQSVYEARKQFGRWLSKEKPVEADIVVPVPDSGTPAALGYSLETGIPFELGIIRNHYVGRTFIRPESSARSSGVKIKLNPQTTVLKGQRVVLVDDSLVRGTTSQMIVRLVRQAGAKEVHVRIASPPTISPCFYGVDTPQKSQLLAAHYSVEEICKFIEADSLSYLSLDGMFQAIKANPSNFCAACFDGKYPTKLEDEVLESLAGGRSS